MRSPPAGIRGTGAWAHACRRVCGDGRQHNRTGTPALLPRRDAGHHRARCTLPARLPDLKEVFAAAQDNIYTDCDGATDGNVRARHFSWHAGLRSASSKPCGSSRADHLGRNEGGAQGVGRAYGLRRRRARARQHPAAPLCHLRILRRRRKAHRHLRVTNSERTASTATA